MEDCKTVSSVVGGRCTRFFENSFGHGARVDCIIFSLGAGSEYFFIAVVFSDVRK
jgi:hypothetical protein